MTSEIHRVKNAISPIFCTKTTDRCVKGKNPLGLFPYKDGFAYDENVCWQGVEERFLFLLLSGLSGICGISCIFASYNSKQQNLKMKNLRVLVVFVLIMHTMVSCRESHREDKQIAGKLEALWNLSECHPDSAAIAFMDFGDSVKHCSEYTRELYNLLCIRIREKRNMTATAVDSVKSIAEYMERHRVEYLSKRLLHLTSSREYKELVTLLENVSNGRLELTERQWNDVYVYVENLYPGFENAINAKTFRINYQNGLFTAH